jgi:hypothetical protein
MKRYQGARVGYVAEVTVDGRPLNPRLDLWNHSPTGFEWGYGGSGPAQLALALLADHLADDEEAVRLHHDFKHMVVAGLSYRSWTLSSLEIQEAVEKLKSGRPASHVEEIEPGGPHGRQTNRLEAL